MKKKKKEKIGPDTRKLNLKPLEARGTGHFI
jgi:hypothetical protein